MPAKRSLISADELRRRLEAAGERAPTLLDVRWELASGPQRGDYLRGHLPGAVFVDLDAELADPPGSAGRHPLPDATRFGAAMRKAGVGNRDPVVVYDAGSSIAAARAWWLLRYFSHPDVRVLDGGLASWRDSGLPLERGIPRPAAGDFEPRPGALPLLDADGAARVAAAGILIDARAEARFRGEQEPIDPVAGHIPGAVNRPSTENVTGPGRLKDAARLREYFARLGVREGVALGAYCGSGVAAAHELLALELAGYPGALYAGSWSEWIIDPERPVARGEQ